MITPAARPKLLAATLLLTGGLVASCGDSGPRSDGPPTGDASARPPRAVVLFVIDTLRADRLGAWGGPEGLTPNLDALARRSVVFEHAHAAAPWTLPSVASMLTSTFPCEHGVVVDGDRVQAGMPTLAERLRDAGYHTASVYENPYAGPMSGLDRGFERAEAAFDTGRQSTGDRIDALLPGPFFLYVHTTDPHDPYLEAFLGPPAPPPARRKAINRGLQHLRRLTRADFTAERPIGTTDNNAKQAQAMARLREQRDDIVQLYAKDVARADHRLGQVVAALEDRGLFDDTLLVVVSDHGEEFDEHGAWQHDQSVYEELMHVPLLIHLPGGRHGGTRIAAPVSGVDLMPTILAAAGLDAAPGARGRNLLPLLAGSPAEDEIRVTGMRINRKKFSRPLHDARGERNVVARQGPWKSIWNVDKDETELYQLAEDPGEKRDLSREHPERSAAMQRASADWLAACLTAAGEGEPEGATETPAVDPADRARLRALGYTD